MYFKSFKVQKLTVDNLGNLVCNFLCGAVDNGGPFKLELVALLNHLGLKIPFHISPFITHRQKYIWSEIKHTDQLL